MNFKTKTTISKERLTVRLDLHSKLKIDELKHKLGVSYSQLLRVIIKDFIIKNEQLLNQVIDKKEEH